MAPEGEFVQLTQQKKIHRKLEPVMISHGQYINICLKGKTQLLCHASYSPSTVKHVLMECLDFLHIIRNKL